MMALPSDLDRRIKRLERKKGSNHPAVKQYYKVIRGAADTVRSIVISANSRLAFLENPQILRILDHDDINIPEIGVGRNGDGKTKTALFCVIPDSDKSNNSIVGCFTARYSRNCTSRLTLFTKEDYQSM